MPKRRKIGPKSEKRKRPTRPDLRPASGIGLQGAFGRTTDDGFDGFIYDPADLTRRFVVELLLDGEPLKLARASAYSHELARKRIGDGCYGFSFAIPPAALATGFVVEARIANDGTPVAPPVVLNAPADPIPPPLPGHARWLGGLRFSGWCSADGRNIPGITVKVDNEPAAVAQASLWSHSGSGDNVRAVRAFDVHLPERFADGRVHRASFINDNGAELTLEPLTFVAFPDALANVLSSMGEIETEKLRAELFDRLNPASFPLSDYRRWRERFPIKTEHSSAVGIAVALIGEEAIEPSLESIERQGYPKWIAASIPVQDGLTTFAWEHLGDFLEHDASHCEIIVFSLAGTRFSPDAMQRMSNAFAASPDAEVIYADVDVERSDGSVWPLALPAFDYERMLEQGYGAHLFAVRRKTLDAIPKQGTANLYRLFNRAADRIENIRARVVHLPGSLGILPSIPIEQASIELAAASVEHLKARGVDAKLRKAAGEVLPAARVGRSIPRGTTTIIIPVRDRPALLRSCLKSIRRAAAAARAEIVIVDNDSSDPEMLAYLDELDSQSALVLRAPGPFNYARLNNIAAEKAQSDYLCLLNNDIQARDDAWLAEMLGRMAEPDVGAVGALLLWPSGVVQHGGVVLGPRFSAAHAFNDRLGADPGYADALRVAHEVSAVTAACLVTRRSDYLAVGGMDELRFPVNYNDVDYCLKLRAAGKRVIFTPHARLVHHESVSRGTDRAADRAGRFERELRTLRARWGDALINDPYYSPMLSLDWVPFSGLAWPPRPATPRTNDRPVAVETPPGF